MPKSKNRKNKVHHHKKTIPEWKPLPDEIIEHIFNFIPNEYLIHVSMTCEQFRRIWKETNHGIVCNMMIKLKYSFKKLSFSMRDQKDAVQYAKDKLSKMFNKIQNELEKDDKKVAVTKANLKQEANRHIELISELGKLKLSKNFTNAISKIDRLDFGVTAAYYLYREGAVAAVELSFGQFGFLHHWEWIDSVCGFYAYDKCSDVMSTKLKELNLTNDEWNAIFECIEGFYNDYDIRMVIGRAHVFKYEDKMESLFSNHELIFDKYIDD